MPSFAVEPAELADLASTLQQIGAGLRRGGGRPPLGVQAGSGEVRDAHAELLEDLRRAAGVVDQQLEDTVAALLAAAAAYGTTEHSVRAGAAAGQAAMPRLGRPTR